MSHSDFYNVGLEEQIVPLSRTFRSTIFRMPVYIHRQPTYRVMPWKNGLGVTSEIVRFPKDSGRDLIWRVSIASVAGKGAFSLFPGCDRILMPLDGQMVLEHDETQFRLAPFEAHYFPGDIATEGWPVDGAVRDFNVVTARAQASARLEVHIVNGQATIALDPAESALLFSPSSVIRIPGSGELQAGDSALVVNERSLEVQGAGSWVVLVRIHTL